jgi:mRNA interferase RelE/StbE
MHQIVLSKPAKKHLAKIETRYQILIAKSIDELQQRPQLGIPFHGELKGYWKLRVSRYRIIYQIIDSQLVVYVIDIDHRRQVYR